MTAGFTGHAKYDRLYQELGSGTRIALAKLAVEKLELSGRPFRLAIDVSIWQFQSRSGKGGTNPAVRTIYYRVLRLLRMSIQPLFVFDGPHKPPFKRNKRTAPYTFSTPDFMVKNMLKLFGVPYITAPGEAEAECALLQKEGVVDAVLSEDVDTLMFGCTRLLRNWNGDASRKGTTPSHVDMYDMPRIREEKGMDWEGIVLAALMSGGDYLPEGIPSCGIKIACEAARAGFGRELIAISKDDKAGLQEWRERLKHELHLNGSGFFRTRHKTLNVPDNFPDRSILYYYNQPVVSSPEQVETYRKNIEWSTPIDVQGLRNFVADAFEWKFKIGARHFIRGLAPTLLAAHLQSKPQTTTFKRHDQSPADQAGGIDPWVKITKQRCHASTDGMRELRIAFRPTEIVPIRLEDEPEACHTATYESDLETDDQVLESTENVEPDVLSNPKPPTRVTTVYDPDQEQKEWIWEVLVKRRMPVTFADWETAQHKPQKPKQQRTRQKAPPKQHAGKEGKVNGTLYSFVRLTKPGIVRPPADTPKSKPAIEARPAKTAVPRSPAKSKSRTAATKDIKVNPWSLALASTASESPVKPSKSATARNKGITDTCSNDDFILITSSPPAPQEPSTLSRPELMSEDLIGEALAHYQSDPLSPLASSTAAEQTSTPTSMPPATNEDDDPFYSPVRDYGARTSPKAPLIPSSSPSLPSPSDILASVAPSKPSSKSVLGRLRTPTRRRPRAPGFRDDASWEALTESPTSRTSHGVEVLDLTSD